MKVAKIIGKVGEVSTLVTSSLVFLVSTAMAQETTNEAIQPLLDIINKVIRALQAIGIAIAVVFLIVAGIYHMTSEGEPQKEEKARRMVKGVIIGLAIIVLAEVIRNVVVNLLS